MGILEVDKLYLELDNKVILNNMTVDFWEGHIHAIVGPNGAGKSTFANALMGLSGYRDIKGTITFKGRDITRMTVVERAREGISLGWQEPARFEGLRVKDFIMAGAKERSKKRVDEVLEQVGLEPDNYKTRSVDKTLSGGERKRIELASLLAMEPKIVILDEPDSGIDVDALNRIFDAITILKKNGSTVLLITHSPTVLEQAEHAFLMCCGEIVDKGSVDKIMNYFQNKCLPCNHKNVPEKDELSDEQNRTD